MKRGGYIARAIPIRAKTALKADPAKQLKRSTGLASGSGPKRSAPPADKPKTPQQQKRATQLRDWAEVKRQAAERDGFRCVGCGSDQQLETHHRHLKQSGGSRLHDGIANALTLCRTHHEYAHAHRNTEAIALGWCVLQGENPAVHPIRAADGCLYLHGDDGTRRRVG